MRPCPMVSVVVPAYGHARFVLETLESVFAQSFQDHEVIVVNDGSPDDTEEVLRGLVESGRIRYVRQANQGVAAARNHGISLARGKYVALLDDDDFWPEDKLEWQVAALEESDAVAIGGTAIFLRDGERVAECEADGAEQEIRYVDLFDGCPFISPGLVLIRRDVLNRAGGFDPGIWGADDHDLWFGLAAEGNLLKRAHPGLFYRCHDSNTSLDSLRMLMNSKKVVDKRLAGLDVPRRGPWRRRGYQYLFRWRGALCLREAAGAMLRFPPRVGKCSRNVRGVAGCFGSLLIRDAGIRSLLWRELITGVRDLPGRLLDRSKGRGMLDADASARRSSAP